MASNDTGRSRRAGRHRANGSLEREIIACLASSATPMTPAQVRTALDEELAYTTVTTVLSRLHVKNAVTRVPAGRTFVYHLAGDTADAQASVTAHRMRRLLESDADRAGVLSRFVDSLDGDTERLLRDLLNADRGDTRAEPEAVRPRRGGRRAPRSGS